MHHQILLKSVHILFSYYFRPRYYVYLAFVCL